MEAKLAQTTGVLPGPVHERSVLLRARSGDRDAFRMLLAQHQARVYGIALRLTGVPDEAARLAQEVCIELHPALPRIASPGHLTRWLLRETCRRVLQWVRQRTEVQPFPEVSGDLPPRRLLLQLPPDARAIVLLRFQEGLEIAEIAAVLDLGESLVEHSLRRSLDWMAAQGAGVDEELEPLLRASLAPPDPGPEFTERILAHTELRRSHRHRAAFASTDAGRARSRYLVVAAVVLVALGATWLALHLSGTPLVPAAAPPAAQAPSPAEPAEPEAPPPEEAAAAGDTEAGQQDEVLQPRDAYPHYVVIAAPLRQHSLDQDAWAPVEAFHAALLEELRKVPDVTLLVPGLTAPPLVEDRPAGYLLTVTSLATALLPSGAEGFRVTDGPQSGTWLAAAGELSNGVLMLPGAGIQMTRRWPVEIRIQSIGQGQLPGHTSVVQVGAESAALATQQVAALRARFFPDHLARSRLAMVIRDDSRPLVERNRALSELLAALRRAQGTAVDMAPVMAVVDYAELLPADQRAEVWRSLRGLRSQREMPYRLLAASLIESLRRDPDEQVRFEALATLAADFSQTAAVRAAVESVATDDSAEVLRMAARRVMEGEDAWRKFVLARLGNTGVSPDERLEPLLLAARSATTPAEIDALRDLVRDPATTRALMELVTNGWFDPMQQESTADALDVLAQADNATAYDLLVQMPRAAPPLIAPGDEPSQQEPGSQRPPDSQRPSSVVSAANMAWLQAHQDNPRVRRMLQDIESGRTDPRMNATIEQMRRLEQRGLPRRPPQ